MEQIHILYFNLDCINPSDGFEILAANGSKPSIFSSNLLFVSQKLFSNDYKKYAILIFSVTFKIWQQNIYSSIRKIWAIIWHSIIQ